MKTQFMITEMSVLQNGKIALAGSVVGSLLVVGQRGSATTASGGVKIEIVSVGIVDSTRLKPNMQALQVKMLEGNVGSLKGITLNFE